MAQGFGHDQGVGEIQTAAAINLGLGQAQIPQCAELGEDVVGGEDFCRLPFIHMGVDFIFNEAAQVVAQGFVLRGEVHGALP